MSGIQFINEPATRVPVAENVDVLVVGGGPAGVAAAVAAARHGARTCLVEQQSCLGGMWTSGLVLTLGGYNTWLRPYNRIVAGIGGEWLQRAARLGGALDNNSWVLDSDPEIMKYVADEMVMEAGVVVYLHCMGTKPLVEGNRVIGVINESISGRQAILAKVTVDCSGNGDIAARAGATFDKHTSLQPMTLGFTLDNVATNPAVDHTAPRLIPLGPQPGTFTKEVLQEHTYGRYDITVDRATMEADHKKGLIPAFGGPWFGGMEKDCVWLNTVRVYGDATDVTQLTHAEIQARKDMRCLVHYLKSRYPAFEQARLNTTGSQIGVRETRRITGLATLTGDMIRNNVEVPDSIAVGGWPIDVHPEPGNIGGHCMFVPLPYGIPYGCLVPKKTKGLLVAGRCISADRDALGSLRVGATCTALGHAAGVAAALAADQSIEPAELQYRDIESALIGQNAIISPRHIG
jgi:hypothetical protein